MEKKENMTKINVIVREEKTDKEITRGCFKYTQCIKCCATNILGAIPCIEEFFEKELNRKDFYIDVRSIVNLIDGAKCESENIKSQEEEIKIENGEKEER